MYSSIMGLTAGQNNSNSKNSKSYQQYILDNKYIMSSFLISL